MAHATQMLHGRARPVSGAEAAQEAPHQAPRGVFWLLLAFLVLEYARPPGIVLLRGQFVITLLIPILWFSSRERPWSRVLTIQFLFLGLCLIGVLHSYNYFAAYLTSRAMYGNVAIALAMVWAVGTRQRFDRLLGFWLAIMAYVALLGIATGGRGPGGFLGDENDLALACCTALPFAFYGFERLSGGRRWLYGALGILLVAATVASNSRGGFVALVAVGAVCLVASRHKLRNLAVICVAAIAFIALAPQSYMEEIRSIRRTGEGTAEQRQFLWRTAANMWLHHPVVGVGGGNFNFHAGKYQPDWEGREFQERNWTGTTVHSAYFQVLSEQGGVGLLLCSLLVAAHFRSVRRLRRDVAGPGVDPGLRKAAEMYSGGLFGGMIGYLVAGIFLSVAYYPYPWYLSALAVAADRTVRGELDQVGREAPGDQSTT